MFILEPAMSNCGGMDVPDIILRLVHYVIIAIQIAVPIILIVMGMLDLGKAVMAGKEDEIKKNQTLFMKRIIAAVIVFLVVAAVQMVFGLLSKAGTGGDTIKCIDTILSMD